MSSQKDPSPIIVGCGFLGKQLLNTLKIDHQRPLCIVRSQESHNAVVSLGHQAKIFDLDNTDASATLTLKNKDIYYFAPPSNEDHQDHRMEHFLSMCSSQPPRKIVYISTSGVYGDCAGAWVDEKHPLAPISDRAKRRAHAESILVEFCNQAHSDYVILRVGGIYGPGRLPIQRLSSITVVCPEEAPYSNRIHVEDLANICRIAMHSQVGNEIINVADGNPTSMTDYYYKIADYAHKPRPPCVPLSQAQDKLSPGMLSFINESRRLSTKKLHARLKIAIQFPTLESGLTNCFNKQS